MELDKVVVLDTVEGQVLVVELVLLLDVALGMVLDMVEEQVLVVVLELDVGSFLNFDLNLYLSLLSIF